VDEGVETAIIFAKINKIPIILSEHVDTETAIKIGAGGHQIRRIKKIGESCIIHFLSPTLMKKAKSIYGNNSRFVVLPNWIEDLSHKYNLLSKKQNKFKVGGVGRLSKMKGFDVLIQAIKELKERGIFVECEIAGAGEESSSLKKIAEESGIINQVKFKGFLHKEEIPYFLSELSAFVQPSLDEALPLVILEAMSLGIPVIATEVGGIPDVVSDGVSGILVEPKNPVALADAIQKLIKNPDLAEKMGREGRRIFLEKFSESVVWPQYEKFYLSLVKR